MIILQLVPHNKLTAGFARNCMDSFFAMSNRTEENRKKIGLTGRMHTSSRWKWSEMRRNIQLRNWELRDFHGGLLSLRSSHNSPSFSAKSNPAPSSSIIGSRARRRKIYYVVSLFSFVFPPSSSSSSPSSFLYLLPFSFFPRRWKLLWQVRETPPRLLLFFSHGVNFIRLSSPWFS